jgi:hypothetical protein
MSRRRAVVGLSVLCALVFSAFAVSSASAATTAGECTSATGNTKDFKDAHCDESVTAGTGAFGHILFAAGTTTNVTATNDTTGTTDPFVLEGKVAGVVIKISCASVSATGTVTNNAGGTVSFGNATTSFTNCTQKAPVACEGKAVTVKTTTSVQTDPMNLKLSSTEKEGPTGEKLKFHEENAAGTEMGLKFSPLPEKPFTEITVSCPTATTAPVKGFTYATPRRAGGSLQSTSGSGATVEFTKSSSIAGLTFAGGPATLEGVLTFRKTGGNPLVLTTTT